MTDAYWIRRSSGAILLQLTVVLGVLSLDACAQTPPADVGTWKAEGRNGAVVAGGTGAVESGLEILRAGGNATDAAVATILALNVTDARSACFGGEVPILIYDAHTEAVEVVAGQGEAPALATREAFEARGGIPGKGLLPAAVPGVLDACVTVLDRHGSLSFARVSAPMLRLLDRHEKPWHVDLARTIRRLIDAEKAAGGDRRRGLRLVADYFYRGPLAREIDAWSREHGGLLRHGDLARHVTRVEEPVTVNYRGYVVHKCGPWTTPVNVQRRRSVQINLTESKQRVCVAIVAWIHLATCERKTLLMHAWPVFSPVQLGQDWARGGCPAPKWALETIGKKRARQGIPPVLIPWDLWLSIIG